MITPKIENYMEQPGKDQVSPGKTKEFPDMQTSQGQETDARDLQADQAQKIAGRRKVETQDEDFDIEEERNAEEEQDDNSSSGTDQTSH